MNTVMVYLYALVFALPLFIATGAGLYVSSGGSEILTVGFIAVLSVISAVILWRSHVLLFDRRTLYVLGGVCLLLILFVLSLISNGVTSKELVGFTFQHGTFIAFISYIFLFLAQYVLARTTESIIPHIILAVVSVTAVALLAWAGAHILLPDTYGAVQGLPLSVYIVLAGTMLLSLYIGTYDYFRPFIRLGLIAVAIVCAGVLISTYSVLLLVSTGVCGVAIVMSALRSIEHRLQTFFHPLSIIGLLLAAGMILIGLFVHFGVFGAESTILSQEVRPSLSTTVHVGLEAFAKEFTAPFLGAGPNSFEYAWNAHMPEQVARSLFWNSDFSYGTSTFATSIIELGIPIVLILLLLSARAFVPVIETVIQPQLSFRTPFVSGVAITFLFLVFWLLVYAPSMVVVYFAVGLGGLILGDKHRGAAKTNSASKKLGYTRYIYFFVMIVVFVYAGVIATAVTARLGAIHAYNEGRELLAPEQLIYDKAFAFFDASLKRDTTAEVIVSYARARLDLGNTFLLQGDPEGAHNEAWQVQDLIGNVHERYPNNYRMRIVYGDAYLLGGISKRSQSSLEKALEQYTHASALSQNRPLAFTKRAQVLFLLDRDKEAEQEMRRALRLRPALYEELQENVVR